MSTPNTDVSSAQQFDVNSFFGNLFNAAATAIAGKTNSPSQATGYPSSTTQPNIQALPGGYVSPDAAGVGGVPTKTLVMVGVGAVVLIAAAIAFRKSA